MRVINSLVYFLIESFAYKQEERLDCGVKAGDAFAGQRRYPQQFFWDFKVRIYIFSFSMFVPTLIEKQNHDLS